MVDVPTIVQFDELGSRVDGLGAGVTLLNSRIDALGQPPEPDPPPEFGLRPPRPEPTGRRIIVPGNVGESWWAAQPPGGVFEFRGSYRAQPPYIPGAFYLAGDGGMTLDGDGAQVRSVFTGRGEAAITMLDLEIANWTMPPNPQRPRASQRAAVDFRNCPNSRAFDLNVHDIARGVGIRAGLRSQVVGNIIERCVNLGVGGAGCHESLIGWNVINECGTHGYQGWESGGMKLVRARGLRLYGNIGADLGGPLIWLDIQCDDFEARLNKAARCQPQAFHFEVSTGGLVADNEARESGIDPSGRDHPTTRWASYRISNCVDVDVLRCLAEISPGSNGVSITQQRRSDFPSHPVSDGITVQDCTLRKIGNHGGEYVKTLNDSGRPWGELDIGPNTEEIVGA